MGKGKNKKNRKRYEKYFEINQDELVEDEYYLPVKFKEEEKEEYKKWGLNRQRYDSIEIYEMNNYKMEVIIYEQ